MNPVEKVTVNRSSHLKLAAAVLALVLILWATGSAVATLLVTSVVTLTIWLAIQIGFAYRHRRHNA